MWPGPHYPSLPPLPCRAEPSTDGQAVLRVNFDPELVKLLREVHDFLLLPSLPAPIPEPALKVYERSEAFRQRISSLELVANMFNRFNSTILPVERPLVSQMLVDAEVALRKGIEVGVEWQGTGHRAHLLGWEGV